MSRPGGPGSTLVLGLSQHALCHALLMKANCSVETLRKQFILFSSYNHIVTRVWIFILLNVICFDFCKKNYVKLHWDLALIFLIKKLDSNLLIKLGGI